MGVSDFREPGAKGAEEWSNRRARPAARQTHVSLAKSRSVSLSSSEHDAAKARTKTVKLGVKPREENQLSIGAGEGNRTLVISLEGCCSTIELHPRREQSSDVVDPVVRLSEIDLCFSRDGGGGSCGINQSQQTLTPR